MTLLRPVAPDEVERFWADGVVRLRRILSSTWLRELEDALGEIQEAKEPNPMSFDYTVAAAAARDRGESLLGDAPRDEVEHGRFLLVTGAWTLSTKMRAISSTGPLPEIAGSLLRSHFTRFYDDQVLIKEPGCQEYSAFHTDEAYWRLSGDQVLAIWVSPDVVTHDSGAMRYVRGSHRWTESFHARDFITGKDVALRTSVQRRESLDIEAHEDDFDVVTMTSEPGDVVVHHYRTIHGSRGNSSTHSTRRAASLRYCGDDVRYAEKPGAHDKKYHGSGQLKDGDPLDDAHFPVVWPPNHRC